MTAWALVVGINAYPAFSKLGVLGGAVADAADFADWALDPAGGGVAPNDLYFWSHPAPVNPTPALAACLAAPSNWQPTLQNPAGGPPDLTQAPTAASIIQTAADLAVRARKAGVNRLYIYLAGHGLQTKRGYSSDPETAYIAGDYLPNSTAYGLVACDDLRRLVVNQGPAEVVLFLDCCRSDTFLNMPKPNLGAPELEAYGANLMCGVGKGAQPGAVSYEIPLGAGERGAFTKVLTYGLRNLRPGGQLTMDRLKEYVLSNIATRDPPENQAPDLVVLPSNKQLVLAAGPPMGPLPEVVIDFSGTPAGTPVQLREGGQPARLVKAMTATTAPVSLPLPIGTYSLETADFSRYQLVEHPGPEPTHVVF